MDFNPAVDLSGSDGRDRCQWSEYNFESSGYGKRWLRQTRISPSTWNPQAANSNFSIVGGAYSNNVAVAGNTTLYAWDFITDSLVTIGGPTAPRSERRPDVHGQHARDHPDGHARARHGHQRRQRALRDPNGSHRCVSMALCRN